MLELNSIVPVVKIDIAAAMLAASKTAVRRLVRNDPHFPRPFRISPNGALRWRLADVAAYVEAKATGRIAA